MQTNEVQNQFNQHETDALMFPMNRQQTQVCKQSKFLFCC